MVINPSILNKIKKVVFLKNEPTQTNVLWAKFVGPNTYSFYLFYEGEWHPTDEITNITISTFSGLISAFTNDVGYLTEHQDISGKLDKTEAVQTYQPKGNYLTEHQSLDAYINAAGYNSEDKRIELKHDSKVVATVDARAFIKDGMVDSVVIQNRNLIITFNVDSGKEPISISVTDIFNPTNYYDKQAIDLKLTEYALKSELFSGSYNDLTDKPVIPTIPSDISAFNNDVGYVTKAEAYPKLVDVEVDTDGEIYAQWDDGNQ